MNPFDLLSRRSPMWPKKNLNWMRMNCDAMEHDGQAIDLGEAVAQTLGLSIDLFPRAPNADEVLRAAGILGEADASPFAKCRSAGTFGANSAAAHQRSKTDSSRVLGKARASPKIASNARMGRTCLPFGGCGTDHRQDKNGKPAKACKREGNHKWVKGKRGKLANNGQRKKAANPASRPGPVARRAVHP